MAKPPVYQLPPDIAEFANRYKDPLSRMIGNRMRQVGVPDEMIGVEWWGVDRGPFVRYQPPQLGGNVRVGAAGKPGINVDPAVFDANAPKVGALLAWRSAMPPSTPATKFVGKFSLTQAPTPGKLSPEDSRHNILRGSEALIQHSGLRASRSSKIGPTGLPRR